MLFGSNELKYKSGVIQSVMWWNRQQHYTVFLQKSITWKDKCDAWLSSSNKQF